MKTTWMIWTLAVLLAPVWSWAEPVPESIDLPPPQTAGGLPLSEALAARQSNRAFAPRPLALQELSSLLWAAAGVNRPDSGKRTAPTARNWQEIDVYVVLAAGTYRYDAAGHRLEGVRAGDLRAEAGIQEFVADAPVVLVYAADFARMTGASDDHRRFYAAVDTGFISQNVYLHCAANGLSTVVLGMVDKEALKAAIGLRPEQHVQLSQPVGFPPPID